MENKLITYKNQTSRVARTSLAIKRGTEYTRMPQLETEVNSVIWIKIPIKNKDPVLLCSGYRQWSLPTELNIKNSKGIKFQKARFNSYLESIKKALALKLKLIIMHDVNIDTSCSNHNSVYNVKCLYDQYIEFLAENELLILNKKITRFSSHQKPSCIDHVITNAPSLLSEVQTKTNSISDHCTLTCTFLDKLIVNKPAFRQFRNFKNITKDKLKYMVAKNINIQNILKWDDANQVAETLHLELNKIIDELAPPKRVQSSKNNLPYLNNELRDRLKEQDRLLTAAIRSKDREAWREHNHYRNRLSKDIMKAKEIYLKSRLDNFRNGWREVKNFNGLEKSVTPTRIGYQGRVITSPKEIANIANDFYISKVIELSAALNHEQRDPIALLSRIIPRREDNIFKLKFISMRETFHLIKKLPNTTATGCDAINNRILKMLGWSIVPQVCHLINCVISCKTFPTIFKTTRIIPVSKPGKPTDSINSFRPINNLPALEKLLEEWIKRCFVDWMESVGVVSGDHHGGRPGYSTLTAISNIKQQINNNLQNKNYNILLTTDLSAAFDTIDHLTLLRKMDHHGVRGSELQLFQSYLKDRKQLVEVDTFRSETL